MSIRRIVDLLDEASILLVELRKIAERLSIEGQLKVASLSEGYLRAKMDDYARSLFSILASLQSRIEQLEREREELGDTLQYAADCLRTEETDFSLAAADHCDRIIAKLSPDSAALTSEKGNG